MSAKSTSLVLTLMLVIVLGCGSGTVPPPRTEPVVAAPPRPLPAPAPLPPKPTTLAVKKADEAYLAGSYAEAYGAYRLRLAVDGNDLDAHDGLLRAAVKLNKLEETVKWYERQLDTYSTSASWCYGAARAMLQSGDLEQSSTLALRATRLDQRLGRAYFLLGLKYYTQAVPRYDVACNAFAKAIQYDPKYGPSYYHLAKLEAGVRGNRTQAKSLVVQGLSHFRPVEEDVKFLSLVLLGGLLSGEKDYAGALEQFQKAKEISGERVYQHVNIGRLHELMGKPELAVKEWQDVQNRFGLARPQGLLAYRWIRRVRSKVALDYSDFLPGGTERDYEVLVSHLLRPREVDPERVPAAIAKQLNTLKTPVRLIETDLDDDGKVEITVVEVRQRWDADLRRYYLANPTLYVFTPKAGILGSYDSQFDHFWDVRPVDFNGDGKKEIISAAFNKPNTLNVGVMVQKGRRYRNTFAQTIHCPANACGVFVDDLDDDGKLEVMSVSGVDLWVTVFRWTDDGTFSDASADFPMFYRDYVKQYEPLKPEQLEQWPVVKEHLHKARALLASGEGTSSSRKATADE
ncbi:MAG TPA: hypothetical protein VMZ92_12015 [Planctomycetota bacterium]|nr:hypothetical protein [Planctomycetota bacterium]